MGNDHTCPDRPGWLVRSRLRTGGAGEPLSGFRAHRTDERRPSDSSCPVDGSQRLVKMVAQAGGYRPGKDIGIAVS